MCASWADVLLRPEPSEVPLADDHEATNDGQCGTPSTRPHSLRVHGGPEQSSTRRRRYDSLGGAAALRNETASGGPQPLLFVPFARVISDQSAVTDPPGLHGLPGAVSPAPPAVPARSSARQPASPENTFVGGCTALVATLSESPRRSALRPHRGRADPTRPDGQWRAAPALSRWARGSIT